MSRASKGISLPHRGKGVPETAGDSLSLAGDRVQESFLDGVEGVQGVGLGREKVREAS